MTAPPADAGPASRDRADCLALAARLAQPFLACADGDLARAMPVEQPPDGWRPRRAVAPFEGLCRVISGLAPAMDAGVVEAAPWQRLIAAAFDPDAPGYLVRPEARQTLVELALLALAIRRAPRALWADMPAATRGHVLAAFRDARQHRPPRTNWLLFPAMIEATRFALGADWDAGPVDFAVTRHMAWYKGDGAYGDGAEFHWDYYNSLVIHPLLIEILDCIAPAIPDLARHRPVVLRRAQRLATVLERMVAPDGSFPPIGRSLAYRCGAFHLLAHLALTGSLPDSLPPGQARRALVSVIRRTLEAPGTFDPQGWLTIGLNGHDRRLGESYSTTGSTYFASLALLPLGLPADARFWADPPLPTTQERLWCQGAAIPRDAALKEGEGAAP